jgi:enamine deaminase RidA (YjgF/YER057c/UK114 family)
MSMNRLATKSSLVALAVALSAASAAGATERVAYPSPAVDGLPYSGAVRAGDMVYVGGVLGTV